MKVLRLDSYCICNILDKGTLYEKQRFMFKVFFFSLIVPGSEPLKAALKTVIFILQLH